MDTYQWYQQLLKPSWAPPAEVFAPAWTVLYILIAVSFGAVFYLAWRKKIPKEITPPFILNLIFNLAFAPIQFGLHNLIWASLDIILILITLIWAMLMVYRYQKWITWLNLPYLIWVSLALVLQLTIAYLNI